jgi:outer membrane protein insertion porin family
MTAGDWYNAKLVEDTVERLQETAGAFGYAFANVQPQFQRSRQNLTMNVTFEIAESPRTYVERIDINGNTLTQDKVIRREFRVAEGDAFNSLAVRRTTNRINSLGYFQENFEVTQVEGSAPDRIVLEANVQEQPTGQLTLSAGFSSLESFIFQGSIQQNNFRGRGQTVGLSANYSRYSRSGSVSFTEPYLFDKNISAGVQLYRKDYNNGYFDRDSATYEQAQTGASFRVGVPLSEYTSLLARYTFNHDNITLDERLYFSDIDGDGVQECEPLRAGRYLCEAIGKRTSSILGLSLVHSNLDSRLRPTRGETASASLDFAGLGGSTRYVRLTSNAAKYWPLGGGFVFSVRGEAGVIKGLKDRGPGVTDVLLTDRFFLGEPQIRGFDLRGVGPRVIRRFYIPDEDGNIVLTPIDGEGSTDDALGGTAYYLGKAEIEIPLGSGARELGLRPSVFLDVGSVFGVKDPPLLDFPEGYREPQRNEEGQPLFRAGTEITTSPTRVEDGETVNNTPLYSIDLPAFREEFYGDTYKPRVSIGVGVNWNSPFGPFRIDVAYPLLKQKGDDTKLFTFNVGTQF